MSHLDGYCVTGSSPTTTAPCPPSSGTAPTDLSIDLGSGRTLACRLFGPPNTPLVVALGGISADRRVCSAADASGWWDGLVGPGRPIDTGRLRVLGIDYLGGLGNSRFDGSSVTADDQAVAIGAALDAIGETDPVTVIGASYGGQVTLAFGRRFGERARRLVVISAAHRAHPHAAGLRDIQRRIIELVPGSRGGVALARALAMTTYRTAEEFGRRFRSGDEAIAYLAARGADFAERCPPDVYRTLSRSIDESTVDPGEIDVPVTLIGVRSDSLVPPRIIEELAARLGGPTDLRWLESPYGHDAFLKESEALGRLITQALSDSGPSDGNRRSADSPRDRGRLEERGPGSATPLPPAPATQAQPEPATRLVRAGIASDTAHGAVMPPIHLSVNYEFPSIGTEPRFDYSRSGNPTRALLEEALAELEGGAGAVVTGSGLSAATLVLSTLASTDVVVAPTDCYGGTRRLLDAAADGGKLRVRYADLWDSDVLEAELADAPRLLWIETPSNPLLRITDIELACRLAGAAGTRTLVDNTFLSPVLQRPLDLGADLALHSTTKFLNGHSDVVGGAVVAATPEDAEELAWWANCLGVTGSAFDAYLTLRGLRTLHARIDAHRRNADAVVEALLEHESVARVWYPGLDDHPGHEVVARQQRGFGSLVTFEPAGGEPAARAVAARLARFTLAESLGGVESLVCHPATMTHAAMSPEARSRAGITDAQLRLSVGIESATDLVADLTAALDAVAIAAGSAVGGAA